MSEQSARVWSPESHMLFGRVHVHMFVMHVLRVVVGAESQC